MKSASYVLFRFENKGEIVAYLREPISIPKEPLEAKANVWKQEVYFAVNELRISSVGLTTSVKKGDVAFWPPENSLCLFYGFNQPYGPVKLLGRILGPPEDLAWVEDGELVHIVFYRDYGKLGGIAKNLREEGIFSAARSWEDDQSIVVEHDGVGLEIYVEEWGYVIESETLFNMDRSAMSVLYFMKLEELAQQYHVRADIDEEGRAILSAYASNDEELVRAVRALSGCYNRFIFEVLKKDIYL